MTGGALATTAPWGSHIDRSCGDARQRASDEWYAGAMALGKAASQSGWQEANLDDLMLKHEAHGLSDDDAAERIRTEVNQLEASKVGYEVLEAQHTGLPSD